MLSFSSRLIVATRARASLTGPDHEGSTGAGGVGGVGGVGVGDGEGPDFVPEVHTSLLPPDPHADFK